MRRVLFCAAITVTMLGIALPARAHPLGNFTTNQYVGVHVDDDGLTVDYVLDLAEIPAAQQRREIDTDADGDLSSSEADSYAESECRRIGGSLTVRVDGALRSLNVQGTHISFPAGEADLVTARLECRLFAGSLPPGPASLQVENTLFSQRLGWREMVLTAEGFNVATQLPAESTTSRLTSYPAALLSSPVDVRQGTAEVAPSTTASRGTPPPRLGAEPPVERGMPVDALASLIDSKAGSPALPIAIAAALGLGVVHALAPGHGKTVMAAYLVGSRGSFGQALRLGIAVAASHTIGVLALGVVTLLGASAFPAERVFSVLSVISGLIVVGIGAWMLLRWLGARRRHHDVHEHHDGSGGHVHTHGGVSHSHALPHGWDEKSGWKVLASMGLAGGLVPSTSAVVLLLAAVNLGRVPLGVLLIVLFGVGMAATLVGVGMGLVGATRLGLGGLRSKLLVSKAQHLLTPFAAVVVVAVGSFLTLRVI